MCAAPPQRRRRRQQHHPGENEKRQHHPTGGRKGSTFPKEERNGSTTGKDEGGKQQHPRKGRRQPCFPSSLGVVLHSSSMFLMVPRSNLRLGGAVSSSARHAVWCNLSNTFWINDISCNICVRNVKILKTWKKVETCKGVMASGQATMVSPMVSSIGSSICPIISVEVVRAWIQPGPCERSAQGCRVFKYSSACSTWWMSVAKSCSGTADEQSSSFRLHAEIERTLHKLRKPKRRANVVAERKMWVNKFAVVLCVHVGICTHRPDSKVCLLRWSPAVHSKIIEMLCSVGRILATANQVHGVQKLQGAEIRGSFRPCLYSTPVRCRPPRKRMFVFLCLFTLRVFRCVRLFPDDLRCERKLWILSTHKGWAECGGKRKSLPSVLGGAHLFAGGRPPWHLPACFLRSLLQASFLWVWCTLPRW